jgi:hypothetical protein
MKNIKLVILGEILLLVVTFLFNIFVCGGIITWYIDIPSIILILVILIPGLIIMGAWKDFIKAFSVGTKHYSLLELKNILGAVSTAQKLVVLGALFALIISAIVVLGQVSDASLIGPNLAICFLTAFYAVIIEMLLLPLHLNAEREMNREMDFEDE